MLFFTQSQNSFEIKKPASFLSDKFVFLIFFFLFFTGYIWSQDNFSVWSKSDSDVKWNEKKSVNYKKDSKGNFISIASTGSVTNRTVTTLDLNGSGSGVNHIVIANVGFLTGTVTSDVAVNTSSGTLTSAKLTFSTSSTGTPASVPNANERAYFYASDGTTQLGFFSINTTSATVYNSVYGTNNFRITHTIAGVVDITDQGGLPIQKANLEALLRNTYYAHAGGTITEGDRYMVVSVTDPNNTLTAYTKITVGRFPVAVDDTNSIAANAVTAITGSLVSNDTDATPGDVLSINEVNGYTASVGTAYNSNYGTINVATNGTYSYTVNTNNVAVKGLKTGSTLTDIISYRVRDVLGGFDFGYITVTVNGVTELPNAIDNSNAVTVSSSPSASGNVIFDDSGSGVDTADRTLSQLVWETQYTNGTSIDGTSRTINGVTVGFVKSDPGAVGGTGNQAVNTGILGGHAGFLGFVSDPAVNPSQNNTLTITFNPPVTNLGFTITDIDYSLGNAWQDQMRVRGSLGATNVSYNAQVSGSVATSGADTFYGTANVGSNDAHANINFFFPQPVDKIILDYNYGPAATAPDPGGQLAGLTDLNWQDTAVPRISAVNGVNANVGVPVSSTYGSVTINGNGNYTYTVNGANTTVATLLVGNTLTDTVSYTLNDSAGAGNTDTANLIVTINGSATDFDGDGVVDGFDLDDDNDGIVDSNETGDTDGDGRLDSVDLDSDNDGINDLTESGNTTALSADANGDGTISSAESAPGADGIPLAAQGTEGTNPPLAIDTDGDGVRDFRDLDSDNDGINDLTESGNAGLTDANSDGVVDGPDADGDGINDSADANDAAFGDPDLTDTPLDTDGDGIPNFRDLDSDNDGINDLTESGSTGLTDANSDGVVDGPDADGDGINDSADSNDAVFGDPEATDTPLDTDGDGIPNFRDLDSDNDGINDLTESGSTGLTDANSDGVVDGPDADGDGINDSADANDAGFGDPEATDTPLDTDGDGIPNFRDLDSDNDGINDLTESGNTGLTDANSDGVVDGPDADGDGINDSADANDAGFGDPEATDTPLDTDGDGIPNFRDLDSDNDGINDLTESGNTGLTDANSDGVVDGPDADGDGINDSADANDAGFGDPEATDTPLDTDGDGIPNFRDLDSDNDGINDLTESGNAGLTDANSDGVVDGPDADGDGINDSADANDAGFGDPEATDTPLDTDGDGIPNFRDLDSDGDGINDSTESGLGLDSDGNGYVDGLDVDFDGIPDAADANDAAFGDPDATDTPGGAVLSGTSVVGTDSDGDGIIDAFDDAPNSFGELSLSNDEFGIQYFKLYPNPVNTILTIEYTSDLSNVSVYNLLGQQVLTTKVTATSTQIDLSSLNAGTYLVKVEAGTVSKTVKVIKK